MTILTSLDLVPAAVALIGSSIAVYTDMRWRIIPNKLNYPMIAIGVGFYLLLGLSKMDLLVAISGALGAIISFVIGYVLWLTGGWAGGDVKLFTALGALLYGYNMPFGNPFYPIPLTILFNSVIASIPVLAIYAIIRQARGRKVFFDEVKITELKEGMIPAETIYEKDGKVGRWSGWFSMHKDWDKVYTSPRRAAGLTRYQVGVLKKLVRSKKTDNRLKIKPGLPFGPALAAGAFILVIFGDIYWTLILSFFGYI